MSTPEFRPNPLARPRQKPMPPATLLAAAAIIDVRAAQGHPEFRRIADELAAEAARITEPEEES